jgi:PilZ domain
MTMTEGPFRDGHEQRRSERVALRIPVHVEYFANDSGRLSIDSVTIKVSAHGALLRLPWGAPVGRELLLENPASHKSQTVKVISVEYVGDDKFDVGVEFTQPNPQFWSVAFPPDDLSPSHPGTFVKHERDH